jgi:hypothetical protein
VIHPRVPHPLREDLNRAGAKVVWSEGLRARTGSLASTRGLLRCVIEIDPVVQDEPECLYEFCLLHEAAHALGRHNLWRMNVAKWLFLPVYPLIVRWQEWRADVYAMKRMKAADFALGMLLAHNEQHHWFGRFVYGCTWVDRFARAY